MGTQPLLDISNSLQKYKKINTNTKI